MHSYLIIITDKNVAKLYARKFINCFKKYKIEMQFVEILPGEKSKDLLVIKNMKKIH